MMMRMNSTSGPRGVCRTGWRCSLTVSRCPVRGALGKDLVSGSGVCLVQDLLDHALGLLLVRARGEHELRHEDLAGLREHALLAGGQTLVAFADGEVPDDFGDLVDVARAQLLDVVLEPAAPVRGHLGFVLAQDVEDLGDFLLRHDVAEPDVLGGVCGNHEGQVAVRETEDEVRLALSEEVPLSEVFDDRSSMLWMDDRLTVTVHSITSLRGLGGRIESNGSTGH